MLTNLEDDFEAYELGLLGPAALPVVLPPTRPAQPFHVQRRKPGQGERNPFSERRKPTDGLPGTEAMAAAVIPHGSSPRRLECLAVLADEGYVRRQIKLSPVAFSKRMATAVGYAENVSWALRRYLEEGGLRHDLADELEALAAGIGTVAAALTGGGVWCEAVAERLGTVAQELRRARDMVREAAP